MEVPVCKDCGEKLDVNEDPLHKWPWDRYSISCRCCTQFIGTADELTRRLKHWNDPWEEPSDAA